jgi:Kef-type K+ transport system membrane component KefB
MSHDLLADMGLAIIGAALLALVARQLRQPLLLGYLVAGALLGPHLGVGLVTDEASIELIAEMGLILLLFIIGLELSVPRLLESGRTIAVSGLLQVPLCVALGWGFAGWLDLGGGRLDRLYVAVALSLSSTLIVVKLLFDKFEMATLTGRLTLGILVFQDLWAIGFLALQPNLDAMQPAALLRSAVAGTGLVVAAVALSRFVLPRLFRAIAPSTELTLITAMAWCFVVAGVAAEAGLSKEMGALVAGTVIAAFPYGTDVTARLGGVRDVFITLFFVALGLRIPAPSTALLLAAAAAAAFVVASRLVVLVPLLAALRMDLRTAGVVAVNLAQISEFSLVIVSLGAGHGHVSGGVASLVIYTLIATSVVSTYGILFNHEIASALARVLAALGLAPAPRPAAAAPARSHEEPPVSGDIFLLAVSREGLAFLQHLERAMPALKRRIVAVDFNPETLEQLQADGVACHYGDVSSAETLRHAGIARATLIVSSVSDWFLRGIDNRRLLRLARSLAPGARVIVTADTLAGAERLYADGAAYVLLPSALAAEHLCHLLRDGDVAVLDAERRRQAAELHGQSVEPEPERAADET